MTFERNVYAFIAELKDFQYELEGMDTVWRILFSDSKGSFHYIAVTKYQDVLYIAHIDGKLCTLEVGVKNSVKPVQAFGLARQDDSSQDSAKKWDGVISSACKWFKYVKKDWIKANKQIHESYPLNRRYGTVNHSLIRQSLPDIYRIDKELGTSKTKKFIALVEKGYFTCDKDVVKPTMTANDFFEYCKIAYLAGQEKEDPVDTQLSGRQMYERYADGRDDGLLEIAGDSQEEFAAWIDGTHPKKGVGGHPWEIKRGGNTTHIDLCVSRPRYGQKEGFLVTLCGPSYTRLKETICMFLAIHEAGLPITIVDPGGIRKRLLGQDNIGMVPCYRSLHRENQHFHKHDDVYDVMHFDTLGRHKRRISPFITWEPLPILKPIQRGR